VATISGTTATLYINDVSIGSQPVSAVVGELSVVALLLVYNTKNNHLPTGNNQALAFGRISGDQFTTNNFFYGSIDDVRIFNRALTAAEIKTLYTSPYGGLVGSMSIAPSVHTGPFTVPSFDPSFVDKTQITGLDNPLGLVVASDGRQFVWQKSGKVYVFVNGQKSLFADITSLVSNFITFVFPVYSH